MTVAIVCPRYSVNPALLNELARIESGKVLKIIGTDKKTDLTAYDKVFVVYQYSLSSINEWFARFLEDNGDLKNVSMVIDVPAFYIESDPRWTDRIGELISFFNSKCDKEETEAAVMNVGKIKKSTQEMYAKQLGAEFLDVINEVNLSKYPVTIVFNEQPDYSMNVGDDRPNLYTIAGVLAILVGILLFYYAFIVFRSANALAPIALVLFGFVLLYKAHRGKRFAHWNGND